MNAVRSPKDFWLGILYLLFGSVALWVGRNYSWGSPGRMGPGYFPAIVGLLLLGFGAVSIGRSFLVTGEPVGSIAVKALVLILGSIAAFGFLIDRLGLIVAATILALGSAPASRHFALERRAVIGLIALVAFCALVFVKGLNVPMPLIGSWLQSLMPPWPGQ